MTDNEIIKAAECFLGQKPPITECEGCGFHELDCCVLPIEEKLIEQLLDLINRQNSNIEELKSKNSSLTSDLTSSRAEIEMIKNDRDFWQDAANFEVGEILKEFAERVKETAVTSITVGGSTYLCVGLHHLDNLVIHGGQIR